MTTTGAVIGSPGYVAPERAHGLAPTPASDLWSLGVTLATALHGRSPFERDTALATMVAAIQEPLPEHVADGPLGDVVSRLLRKDPAERPTATTARGLLSTRRSATPADHDPTATTPLPRPVPSASDPGAAERTQALPLAPAAAAGAAAPAGPAEPAEPAGSAPAPAPAPAEPTPAPASGAAAGRAEARPAPGPAPRPRPAAPATPATPAAPPGARRSRSRALPVLLAVVSLVVAGMVLAVLLDRSPAREAAAPDPASTTGSEQASEPAEPEPTAATEAPPPAEPEPEPDDEPVDEPQPDADPTAAEGGEAAPDEATAVPDGFRLHEDPAYRVAVPEGWQVEPDGETRTRFVDPDSRRYLLVEEGGEPAGDPVEDWESQEGAVADRLDGYERISIEPGELRDFDVADWQFTWEPSGGTLRVLNRAVVTDGQAYALYWSVPAEEWESSRDVLDDIAGSFQPDG
ncbi:hypothetical protein [Jannaschia sp. R86511]|uniref:protein kinase domain-containing protein n=1 Tax=Jannaschia sp. R86511 TaxID=3093853 RepID=UPI0036D410D8